MTLRKLALIYTPLVKRFTAVCAAVMILSLFLYAVFLLEAVAHTATRAHAESKIEALSSEVSSLETQYLLLTRTMTPARAQELGFVAPSKVTTVFETGGVLSLHE